MLIDRDGLARQLQGKCEARVGEAYELLALAVLPQGMVVQLGNHVYGASELQFHINERYHFAAVLNQKWILWYVRRPAFADTAITVAAVQRHFPTAEANAYGEVKLRLLDRFSALAMIGLVHQHYPLRR